MDEIERKIKIFTLYRYYLYAVVMRDNLNKENLGDFIKQLNDDISSIFLIFSSRAGVYLTYFYSAIYLVVEGWKDLELSDDDIDNLINSPYIDRLRRFRNATFHYQKEPISPKLLNFFGTEEEATEKWINELYKKIGDFFKKNSLEFPNALKKEIKGKGEQEMAVLVQKYYRNIL
jgi:hypothetical protein